MTRSRPVVTYINFFLDEISSYEEIGTSETEYIFFYEIFEVETLLHLQKFERTWTSWIFTTSSLSRTLQILFLMHKKEGQLFVACNIACLNVFTASKLSNCLSELKNNEYLRNKQWNEFLIHEKYNCETVISTILRLV